MISAAQIRGARPARLAPLMLAVRAFLALDDVTRAIDHVASRRLGGFQLGAVRDTLEAAGVEFLNHGEVGAKLREIAP